MAVCNVYAFQKAISHILGVIRCGVQQSVISLASSDVVFSNQLCPWHRQMWCLAISHRYPWHLQMWCLAISHILGIFRCGVQQPVMSLASLNVVFSNQSYPWHLQMWCLAISHILGVVRCGVSEPANTDETKLFLVCDAAVKQLQILLMPCYKLFFFTMIVVSQTPGTQAMHPNPAPTTMALQNLLLKFWQIDVFYAQSSPLAKNAYKIIK